MDKYETIQEEATIECVTISGNQEMGCGPDDDRPTEQPCLPN